MRLSSFLRTWLATFVAFGLALAFMLASPAAYATITFDNTPSGGAAGAANIELIRDTAAGSPTGQYIGLRVSSSIALTNVYARAIVGGVGYSLDATQAQDQSLGDLAGTAKTPFWFINIPTTLVTGTFTVQIYRDGPPGVGTLEGTSSSYPLVSANSDSVAGTNNIASVVINGGSPLVLGQNFDAVICYAVQSNNNNSLVSISPAATSAFDPTGLQLLNVPDVRLYNAGANCSGALLLATANQLYYPTGGSSTLQGLKATYTFRAMNPLATSLSPIVASRNGGGGTAKYNGDFSTFLGSTVPAASNAVTLAKSVSVAESPGAVTALTYTITATNTASVAVTLDSFIDTLPSSPATVTYVAGSARFDGAVIANPTVSGQVLTWGNPGGLTAFSIPANSSRSLTFQANIPATNGIYTNRAIAKIGAVTIDTTLATGDNTPATAVTRIGPPVLTVTKTANTPTVVNTAAGTTARYTLKVVNTGTTAEGVKIFDTALPTGFTYSGTVAVNMLTSASCPVAATRLPVVNPTVGATAPSWGDFTIRGGCEVSVQFDASVANTVADDIYSNSASTTTTTTPATIINFDGTPVAVDNVTVTSPVLAVTKTTSTPTVTNTATGTTATYTITVANTGTAATEVKVSDTLETGFTYASTSRVTLNGTAVLAANFQTITTGPQTAAKPQWDTSPAGGFTINAGQSLVITFVANVSSAVASGTYNNSAFATGNARTISNFDGTLPANTAEDVTVVAAKLTVTKVFLPNSIGAGDTTQLKITLINSNAFAVTGAAFTDTYPGGLLNTAAPGELITGAGCGGSLTAAPNGSSLALTTGNVPANSTCDITVNVSSATANTYVNSTGAVTTTNAGTSASVNGTLVVLSQVTVIKAFTPNSVAVNATSVLKITLTNPNAVALTSVAFNDTYPGGLVNTGTPGGAISGPVGCSGTVTAAPNGTSLVLSNGIVPASSSCVFTANVSSATAGSYVNNSGAVSTANAGVGASSGATLTVTVVAPPPAPQVAKSFTPNSIGANGTTLLKITLVNVNAFALTSVAFTDTYPASMFNTATPAVISGSAGCSGTVTAANNGSSLSLSGGNLPANGTCDISVSVTSAVAGTYVNSSGAVSSAEAPNGTAATGTLTVLANPTLLKAFTPTSVAVNAASVLRITVTNPNGVALTGVAFTDTYPAGLVNTGNALGTISGTGCTGSVSAANNGTSLALTGGTVPAGASCDITVNVTSASVGSYSNTSGGASSTQTVIAGEPSNTAVLTVTAAPPVGVSLSGFVYNDPNHNLQRDGGESGTGLTLYAKLIPSAGGNALQAVAVNPTTGAYTLAAVTPGNYSIILDDNNVLTDTTPTIPLGWLGTEMPNSVRTNLLVGTTDLQNLNFGLFNGSTLGGTVFADTGIVGGTANNGSKDGGEIGIAGVAVKASSGATTHDTTMTDGAGNYLLWIPAAATSPVEITETNLGGFLSTGGSAGTTAGAGGTYTRTSDSTSFTFAAGLSYLNVNFGDVPVNRFVANGQQSGLPGNALFYPHQFNAGSGGSVILSVVSASSWPVVLYRDTNCNGVIDTGENVISAAITVLAAEQICLINKVTIPAGTALGAQDAATLQASFTYTNANPGLSSTLALIDSTTVGAGSAGLVLTKTTDKATALPGDTINYTVSYQNNSSTPLANIVISDATPAFTTFVSAGCTPLPTALTTCTATTSPAPGGGTSIQWTLTGALNPASVGQVVFAVKVNN